MSDIVERLREGIIAPAFEAKRITSSLLAERLVLERREAADTITRLTAENEMLRAALERAEGGFYNMANAIDDYDYHGPAPQCTGDIIGHREQFHRVHVEQLVKYAEECRAALGFTPLHKETSNDRA